ncbi:hypothetical protein CEUSTIGMA_g4383.t1 [Chlamydomonas eustigma]|uniref:Uncharacterized protein n=1 Tax=Chlamydomonas eustigma TaxID=1157962 RepID=A0A250X1K4_9CHLO|nr:hypothetical protein CEUSTIGMA_g4383.t1 [Chlamydomonas eustigma]|eukprot:GAX76936.1 hypothetical protein CEUSTIGMA_g4383.t1 [Chlamydomonas eustigma]
MSPRTHVRSRVRVWVFKGGQQSGIHLLSMRLAVESVKLVNAKGFPQISCSRGRRFSLLARGSAASRDNIYEPQPTPYDPVASAFKSCSSALIASGAFLVSGLSDLLVTVAHPDAPRVAVENSVKAALTLLALALVQNVISVFLIVGAVALLVYVASQVFGLTLLPLSVGLGSSGVSPQQRGRAGASGADQEVPSRPRDNVNRSRDGTSRTATGAGSQQYRRQQEPSQSSNSTAFYPPWGNASSSRDIADIYYER